MILTILQYIEAFTSPDGRIRTLERLHPVYDAGGGLLLSMPGHGMVDFEVMARGERHTLRCPLMWDGDAARRLRAFAEKDRGLEGRFYTEWRVLGSEVVLFGDDGGAFEVDVLARPAPAGEPFVDFLERATQKGDANALETVGRSFEELAAWADRVGRGGVAPHRLIVGPDGAVRLTGFSAYDRTERIREMLQEAADVVQKRSGTADETETTGYGFGGDRKIRLVKDGGGWMYVDRLGHAVIDGVWTRAEPFRGERAEVETPGGKGLIDTGGRRVLPPVYEEVIWDDYWGVAAVMTEGRWSLADSEGMVLTTGTYDWLGECSEGLLLAQKGDKCGFIDTAGREVMAFVYDDASSFSEGCAQVDCGGESFLIDARGNRINP